MTLAEFLFELNALDAEITAVAKNRDISIDYDVALSRRRVQFINRNRDTILIEMARILMGVSK